MGSELYNKLIEYCKSDYYAFHMPGHKRNTEKAVMNNPFEIDITEINGFDNLHNPQEIILDEMNRASEFYGSDQSYFLVNGSTCGNMSAISAVAGPGDKIIVARNCHKSVMNVMELRHINPIYLYPELAEGQQFFGETKVEQVRSLIKENPDAKAVVITSPTYEGIVSDIVAIAKCVHENGMALIVDGAHGAHFSMWEGFPKSGIECGADVVVESLHKTLPSLTQTAILHYKDYGFVKQDTLEKYLGIYQSSSPSYVLMSSICNCVEEIVTNGEKLGREWSRKLNEFRNKLNKLNNLYIYSGQGDFDYDQGKIVIGIQKHCQGISGRWMSELLREKYHLEVEMQAGNYVIAMTSPYDTNEGMNRLACAVLEIDETLNHYSLMKDKQEDNVIYREPVKDESIYTLRNKTACQAYQVDEYDGEDKKRVSDKYVYMYPPGIPLIVPGEIPDDRLVNLINEYKQMGYEIIEQK